MKKTILRLLFIVFLAGCIVGKMSDKHKLTDEKMEKYLKAYKALRQKAPDVLRELNANGETPEAGQEGFNTFENTIKDAGLDSYTEFVILNAKVGSIFSLIQAESGMETFGNLRSSGNVMFDDGIAQIEEQLQNPDLPEETRIELEKAKAELQKGQSEMNQTYEENEKWANLVIDNVQKLTGLIVDEDEVEVVKKYEDQILQAYTGFDVPYKLDGDMTKMMPADTE